MTQIVSGKEKKEINENSGADSLLKKAQSIAKSRTDNRINNPKVISSPLQNKKSYTMYSNDKNNTQKKEVSLMKSFALNKMPKNNTKINYNPCHRSMQNGIVDEKSNKSNVNNKKNSDKKKESGRKNNVKFNGIVGKCNGLNIFSFTVLNNKDNYNNLYLKHKLFELSKNKSKNSGYNKDKNLLKSLKNNSFTKNLSQKKREALAEKRQKVQNGANQSIFNNRNTINHSLSRITKLPNGSVKNKCTSSLRSKIMMIPKSLNTNKNWKDIKIKTGTFNQNKSVQRNNSSVKKHNSNASIQIQMNKEIIQKLKEINYKIKDDNTVEPFKSIYK